MPADTTSLKASVDALLAQVELAKGVNASAIALIVGFGELVTKKVAEALAADNAADQGSIDAASKAIADAVAQATADTTALGDAVAANG